MFAIRSAATVGRRQAVQQSTRGIKSNIHVEEFAGMRETTEKRFTFDAVTIKRVIGSCILFPAFLYVMVLPDSEAWAYGRKGHTAGRAGIMPRPSAAEEEEE